jgi:DNA-binding transcriptional LysR family regulator
MDINQLEVLVAVAREKSFSRAAETLGRTQPAVSQAIRRLEQEVGERLFDRSSKDGTLTLAGELLLDYARQMLNLRQTAQTAIKEMRDLRHGKLSISANEHTVFYLLPLLGEFRKLHPAIKIEVHRGVASRIPKEVAARETELGVVSFKPNDPSVKAIPVGTDEMALFVSPSHPFASRGSVSIKELATQSFIAHNAPSPFRQRVIEAFEKNETELNIAIELPSLEAIKRLVEKGVGVALLPKLSTESEIRTGQLKVIRVSEMRLERRLHLIYRRNSELSHAAKAFLKLAREVAD